jgi:hypothetical protein
MRQVPAALLAAVILAGCGGGSAPAGGSSPRAGGDVSRAGSVRRSGPGGSATSTPGSPVPVIERFADAYINWSAAGVAADLASLAHQSVGQAASEMAMAAVQTSGDSTIAQGGISNSGTVEAVAPRIGQPGQYLVVTRESTAASASAAYQGLAPAWHLTIATVTVERTRRGARWVISGWQPES